MKLKCTCKGILGPTLTQEHDNPGFAEYKVCTNCEYQWAKKFWNGLSEIPFSPVLASDGKSVEINLGISAEENKNIKFTEKAYNEFLGVIVEALEFNKKEKFDLSWSKIEDHLGLRGMYHYSFSWMNGTNLEIDEGENIGAVINDMIDMWVGEDSLEANSSGTFEWKHNPVSKPMKFVWINELFNRLTPYLNYDTKESKKYNGYGVHYWTEIRQQVISEADKYIPHHQSIGGKSTLVSEGGVCKDSNLILGLLLCNAEHYFYFDDCVFEGSETSIYIRDLAKKCKGKLCSYQGTEIIWESKTIRNDNWVLGHESVSLEAKALSKEDRYSHPLSFGFQKPYRCRAWIVKEIAFCGKSRLAARKYVIGRDQKETIITTGIKELNGNGEFKETDKNGLLKSIFGSNKSKKELKKIQKNNPINYASNPAGDSLYPNEDNLALLALGWGSVSEPELAKPEEMALSPAYEAEIEADFVPLTPRELLFTDQQLDFIIKKLLNQTEEKKASTRLIKHRLGSRLIEIGQFLEWWKDLGDVMADIFSDDEESFELKIVPFEGEAKIPEMPLRVFGSGVRTVFDKEYDHEERDVVTMGS